MGVYKPRSSDLIKYFPEIVSAEIKMNPQGAIEAFGQAAAYRLFSNRVYIVMPDSISDEDFGRLEALCMLYGIGLILITIENAEKETAFSIRVRAQRFSPDLFYVNEFAKSFHRHNPDKFEKLFG